MSGKKEDDRVKEQLVTYDVYAAMPEDGHRYEIFDGVLEMMSPGPSTVHQGIGMELSLLLSRSCKSDYVILTAPLDVILSRMNVLQPDIVMVHRSRMEILTMRGIEGAPDLVVEVLSPGSRKRDRVRKLPIYAKHGVPEYWIVDPSARTLEQLTLAGGKYEASNLFEEDDVVASEKLSCVSFKVSELFADESIRRLLGN
ncbi:Uma2 family endonuclease [Cohnella sp. GCM10027633]|uniref:Uma2 family endonuclease n=1 Tax=unclassified Cohnella TaxID=2636738 RepID=UPI00363889DA